MPLIKTDMINTLYRDIGISKKKSTQVMESLIAIIKDSLEHGEDVMISGLGKKNFGKKAHILQKRVSANC